MYSPAAADFMNQKFREIIGNAQATLAFGQGAWNSYVRPGLSQPDPIRTLETALGSAQNVVLSIEQTIRELKRYETRSDYERIKEVFEYLRVMKGWRAVMKADDSVERGDKKGLVYFSKNDAREVFDDQDNIAPKYPRYSGKALTLSWATPLVSADKPDMDLTPLTEVEEAFTMAGMRVELPTRDADCIKVYSHKEAQ